MIPWRLVGFSDGCPAYGHPLTRGGNAKSLYNKDLLKKTVRHEPRSSAHARILTSQKVNMATPEQKRILIVDDDPGIRTLMAKHFSRKGFQVEQAEAAEEVLDLFGGDVPPFDVVLTDIHLPGQSGVDLARRIKLVQPDQAIVFMTGDADEAIARQALRSGAASFLLKPFQFFEIDTAVRNALQRNVVPVDVPTAGTHKHRRRPSAKVRLRIAAVVAVMLLLGWIAGAGFDSPDESAASADASTQVPVVVGR